VVACDSYAGFTVLLAVSKKPLAKRPARPRLSLFLVFKRNIYQELGRSPPSLSERSLRRASLCNSEVVIHPHPGVRKIKERKNIKKFNSKILFFTKEQNILN